jgi:hypothetical protein
LLSNVSQHREWGCEREPIPDFRLAFRDGAEEVIVLHELEDSLDHCVLKVAGRIESRNLAGEVLTDAKVFGPPPHELTRPDEAGGDSVYGSLTRPLGP